MLIHISDCQSFDQNIVIQSPCTVHSLLEQIMEQFKYDTTLCSVFQNGKELEFGVKITPELIKNDNTLVLFNQLFFKEKSYTNADQTFNFRPTRFQNHFFESNFNKINIDVNSKNTNNSNTDFQHTYLNYLQNQIYPEFTISQEQDEINEPEENNSNDKNNNDNDDDNEQNDIESLADLDPSEQEAVDRLCSLGFERSFVIQIYMACDRNEEAAIELLRSM